MPQCDLPDPSFCDELDCKLSGLYMFTWQTVSYQAFTCSRGCVFAMICIVNI